MPSALHLFGLSGSLRKDSYSTAVLRTLAETIAPQAKVTIGNPGLLPHYNEDMTDDNLPEAVKKMRAELAETKGLLIVSPEYHHGVPGVLKNALDWLLGDYYSGKIALVISCSPAFTGGVRVLSQLRETLLATGVRAVATRDVVISNVNSKVKDGRLHDKAALDYAMKAVAQLVNEAGKIT